MIALLLLLAGCTTSEPERDTYGCWTDDREIWLTLWEEWCGAMEACGTLDSYGNYSDLEGCLSDARDRVGNDPATCLNGCDMDFCLEDIATYRASCLNSDAVGSPPGVCGLVLGKENPYTECDP